MSQNNVNENIKSYKEYPLTKVIIPAHLQEKQKKSKIININKGKKIVDTNKEKERIDNFLEYFDIIGK